VKLLRESGDFIELPPLSEDWGILVFERAPTAQDGRKLLDLGDVEAGVALLEMLVDIRPKDPEAWANLTLGYVLAGQEQDALAAGERALDLNPQHFYVHEMLAEILFEQHDFESALMHIEAALSNPPNATREASALVREAMILEHIDLINEACRTLEIAVSLDPALSLPVEAVGWGCSE
jgi:tetratricopeptide (TPR) repeat protein